MSGRCFAWMVVVLAAACAPGNREPAPEMPGPHPAPPAAATRQESGATHHAHVRGTVVGRDGQPLGGVQLLADRLPAATADMPRARAVTRTDGTFALPLRATLHADSARVEVKVVAFGFIYATGGALPADSVVVPVTMVPAARQPNVYTTRLTLPVSRR